MDNFYFNCPRGLVMQFTHKFSLRSPRNGKVWAINSVLDDDIFVIHCFTVPAVTAIKSVDGVIEIYEKATDEDIVDWCRKRRIKVHQK